MKTSAVDKHEIAAHSTTRVSSVARNDDTRTHAFPRRSGPLGGPDVCQERSGLLTYKKFRRAKRKEAIYCPLVSTTDSIRRI
jgi:hypothetical protein